MKVSDALLHLLDEDKSLMNGTGGWSYTLNRAEMAEKPGVEAPTSEMSYPIAPAATGSNVFGVFEGRTPCNGISRELNRPEKAGCIKAKWRVTLYQKPGMLHADDLQSGRHSVPAKCSRRQMEHCARNRSKGDNISIGTSGSRRRLIAVEGRRQRSVLSRSKAAADGRPCRLQLHAES